MSENQIKVLELYLDLNKIEPMKKYLKVGEVLLEKDLDVYNMSFKSKIFDFFQDYINWDISKKKFLSIGDLYGDEWVNNNNWGIEKMIEIYEIYKNDKEKLKDSLILLDQSAKKYCQNKIDESEYQDLIDFLKQNNSHLFFF